MTDNFVKNSVFVWTLNGNVYIFSDDDAAENFLEELIEEFGEESDYSKAFIVDPYDYRR